MVGKVIEVFIPNNDLDMIGFKIQVNDEVMEVVQKQDMKNASIYREDIVEISYDKDNTLILEKVLDYE